MLAVFKAAYNKTAVSYVEVAAADATPRAAFVTVAAVSAVSATSSV